MPRLIKHALDVIGISIAACCALNSSAQQTGVTRNIYSAARQLSPSEVTGLITSPSIYQCLLNQTNR